MIRKTVNHFTDLEAWKLGHELVLEIYRVTKMFPVAERFGIIDQLRRAAISITANIAEGWGRFHFADCVRFYHQSRGSLAEVENFLILSKDLKFLSVPEFERLYDQAERCFQVLNGLIRSVERTRRSFSKNG